MLCRIEMPMSEGIYGRFYRWKVFHRSGMDSPASKSSIILLPVLAVLITAFLWPAQNWLIMGAVWLLAIGFAVYTLWVRPAQIFRKREGAALLTEVYIFTENGFTRSVRSEEGGAPDNLSAQYSALHEAVETKNDFYLFTSRTQAYLIDKEYFDKGTPEELSALLKKKCPKKTKKTPKK